MITGVVTASLEAIIRLTMRSLEGREREIEALIDTGFNGSLTLPPAIIAALGLPWRRCGRAMLADGSESLFDIYEARVFWDGAPRRVAVDGADTHPLIGMRLLQGYELTIQVRGGGRVSLTALASI